MPNLKQADNHTSQTIGLDISLAIANLITGKENLHYGIWENLEVSAENLGKAQEAYTEKLLNYIPQNKSLNIIDIGGGAGETAKILIKMGHKVTIVIPSPILAERAKKNTNGLADIKICTFENYKPTEGELFDLCLFSESFQYIPLHIALRKSKSLLKKNGCILIADCFRSNTFHKGINRPPGGGHLLKKMYNEVKSLDLQIKAEEDITKIVSGSIDLEQKFYNTIGFIINRISAMLKVKYPILFKLGLGIYKLMVNKKKRIRLNNRLFENTRSSKEFIIYNKYKIFLLES